jgi:hypothetical protein
MFSSVAPVHPKAEGPANHHASKTKDFSSGISLAWSSETSAIVKTKPNVKRIRFSQKHLLADKTTPTNHQPLTLPLTTTDYQPLSTPTPTPTTTYLATHTHHTRTRSECEKDKRAQIIETDAGEWMK